GLGPLAAVLAEIRRARAQVSLQRLAIFRPARRVAQRVQVHLEGDPQPPQPAIEQLDLLRIDARTLTAERLHADLRELPVPPGPLEDRRARFAITVQRKQFARGLLDQQVVPGAHPGIVILHIRVGGQHVPRALDAANFLAHSSASPSLMIMPGCRRSASFTPGAKSTTTAEPISK